VLVLVGVPMLVTIAVTQIVVFTALCTAFNYLLRDAVVASLFVPITAAYLGASASAGGSPTGSPRAG